MLTVPPTVNPFIFNVGCPTPTGTPCPFFPQVPIPGSIFKSLPTNSTFFKTSKPDPIKGATLIGSGFEVLKKVEFVGNDLKMDPGIGTCGKNGQGVPVGVGQPTL